MDMKIHIEGLKRKETFVGMGSKVFLNGKLNFCPKIKHMRTTGSLCYTVSE